LRRCETLYLKKSKEQYIYIHIVYLSRGIARKT